MSKRQMDTGARAAVVAFIAVVGVVNASDRFSYNGESWKQEFDLVDFAQMDLPGTFYDWATEFERSFTDEGEEFFRFNTFVKNLQVIAQHNSNPSNTYKMRPNQFTDMEPDEFARYIHGGEGSCYKGAAKSKFPLLNKIKRDFDKMSDLDAPASVDWTTQGVVTPVKNQGNCGSCWAFSTTGSLECNYAIQKGTLNSLSEQQLVDCSTQNSGCNGGLMDYAFAYVEKEGGLCSESEYPYTGRDGTCKSSSCGTMYDANKGYTDVTTKDESALVTAAAAGCVSVAIEADQYAFQSYSSGVLTGTCGTRLDHGVLVVGYGTEGSTEYWKVKNSWGESWGEDGYVLICKDCGKNGSQGECGINDEPSYPTF